jgi:hypothetical protein
MPLRPFEIKPGIVKDITAYAAGKNGPFWTDGDKVRFRNGFATKIGGWQKDVIYALNSSEEIDYNTEAALQGVPREILFWRTLAGVDTMAVGTHNHLYVIQNDGIFDITPLITSASLTNPVHHRQRKLRCHSGRHKPRPVGWRLCCVLRLWCP